jgi:hypothetical protein
MQDGFSAGGQLHLGVQVNIDPEVITQGAIRIHIRSLDNQRTRPRAVVVLGGATISLFDF